MVEKVKVRVNLKREVHVERNQSRVGEVEVEGEEAVGRGREDIVIQRAVKTVKVKNQEGNISDLL